MNETTLSRRQFLWVGAALGGGLLVQVACRGRASAESVSSDPKSASPSIFIRIAPDDTVSVTIPKSEMGQGVRTVVAQIAAEELGLTVERISVVSSDTGITPYDPSTGGSRNAPCSG